MIDVEKALMYPFQGGGVNRILLGGVLTTLSVFLLPIFILLGYYMDVFRRINTGCETPPTVTIESIPRFFIDGVYGVLIVLVYSFPSIILAIIGAVALFTTPDVILSSEVITIIAFTTIGVFTIMLFITPAALYRFAVTERIKAAFNLRQLFQITLTKTYIFGLVLVIIGSFITGSVVTLAGFTPLIGWAVAPFIQFSLSLTLYHILATAIKPHFTK
jgi:hypothetical protein